MRYWFFISIFQCEKWSFWNQDCKWESKISEAAAKPFSKQNWRFLSLARGETATFLEPTLAFANAFLAFAKAFLAFSKAPVPFPKLCGPFPKLLEPFPKLCGPFPKLLEPFPKLCGPFQSFLSLFQSFLPRPGKPFPGARVFSKTS